MAANVLEQLLFAGENVEDLLPLLFAEIRPSTFDGHNGARTLEDFTDAQCKVFFRFHKIDIHRLAVALRIPDRFVLPNRTVEDGVQALIVFLARLAYPCRLVNLEDLFGRPKSTLSFIIQAVLEYIYDNFNAKISRLDQPFISEQFQEFADAIHAKGAPLKNCIGFIDETVRPLCRPTIMQRTCYNGHKRVHAIKFQSIVTPNGLIANLFGPIEGRRHDCFLLRGSGIMEQFEQNAWMDRDENSFCPYGDPAYPIRGYLIAPYRNPNADQQAFNGLMSSARVSVEWEFGKLVRQFSFLDYKKNLKLFLQPVAKIYLVGGILLNCHTCLYGSQTSEYFGLKPPELETYLQ